MSHLSADSHIKPEIVPGTGRIRYGPADLKRHSAKRLIMIYDRTDQLPEHIRTQLPEPAQELYLAAYNRSLEKARVTHAGASDAELANIADQAAWLKVQEEYQQDEQGRWHKDSIGKDMDENTIPVTSNASEQEVDNKAGSHR
jgi:cation transport regulator